MDVNLFFYINEYQQHGFRIKKMVIGMIGITKFHKLNLNNVMKYFKKIRF